MSSVKLLVAASLLMWSSISLEAECPGLHAPHEVSTPLPRGVYNR